MTSGKIVKKFFSKAEAVYAATYQRAQAKKEGRIVLKVRVVNAYELYMSNGWFKANPFKMLGTPGMDQYMVVVFYNLNITPVAKTSALKKKIVKAAKTNTASKIFKVVRLNVAQLNKVKAIGFVHASDSTVPVVRFSYRVTHTLGDDSFTSTSFAAPTYRCQIAA